MLITFHTDAYADITLFGDVALGLLKMMGHSGSVPGALLAADLPAALTALKAGVAKSAPVQQADADEPAVSVSSRALPLISLIEAAIAAKADVMWD